jgi:eukaryotic-like serine/threonine-protein kinase
VSTTAESFAGGRYRVARVMGRGGMATVYLARDAMLDRQVAVKVLAEHLADDPAFVRRFRREASIAAGLAHPHIVELLDVGDDRGRFFIVMEHVDGETLHDLLEREGPQPAARVAELGRQAASALAYAHEAGLVHRDVKPANLLLRRDGVLKVADFGIARLSDATQITEVGTVLGTPRYVAPEQARGEAVGPAADVYSLGVVLYELLTGSLPGTACPVAGAVEPAIRHALEPEPARRPTARELASSLGDGPATRPLAGPAPARIGGPPGRSTHRSFSRRRLLLAGAIVALVVAVAVAVAVVASRGGASAPSQPRVASVPRAADPARQAHLLAGWIRANSG